MDVTGALLMMGGILILVITNWMNPESLRTKLLDAGACVSICLSAILLGIDVWQKTTHIAGLALMAGGFFLLGYLMLTWLRARSRSPLPASSQEQDKQK